MTAAALLPLLVLSQPKNFEAAFERVDSAVVTLRVGLTQKKDLGNAIETKVGYGTGTGVVLHPDGFIATAAHVVEEAEVIAVELRDGVVLEAEIVTLSRTEDLALLKVNGLPKNVAVAALGDSDAMKVGAPVFSIGTPLGLTHTLTAGVVSGLRQDEHQGLLPGHVIQTDAALNQGNSGGPLFNEKGEVIGICSYIASTTGGSIGLGFAVPSNTARRRLFEHPIPYLGVSLRHLDSQVMALFNWPYQAGMLIEAVRPGSAAAKAGLRGGTVDATVGANSVKLGGDLIIKVGDLNAQETEKIGQYLVGLKEGAMVHYTLLREGKLLEVDVPVPHRIPVPALAKAKK
jgi:serine protease Do